jgi:hypothetical protein
MRTNYLSLSAFACVECNGPVISGSVGTRETEIQRETDVRQIGSICLSCKKQYGSLPTSRAVRHLAPFEWRSPDHPKQEDVSPPEAASGGKQRRVQ